MKEKLSYITCIVAFAMGWLLTVVGFFIPPSGEVSDSVLWILGQSLLYTGAVLGIGNYYNVQLNKFKTEIKNEIKQ